MLNQLRERERERHREFRSFDEFGRTMPEIMAEDTGRQRLRIGLHPDWITPRGQEIQPKIDSFNPEYKPSGGDKKIFQEPVEIQAGSKVQSLENKDYQPGGGDKQIFNERLEFEKAAKAKVGSLENADYKPGGGDKQFVFNQRLRWRDQPVLNTRENIDYHSRPAGKRIFNDRLDFLDKAAPKVGSLENKDYEPRPPGVRVYHERLPWLEYQSNRPHIRRTSEDGGDAERRSRRQEYAKHIDSTAQQQPPGDRPHPSKRASSEEGGAAADTRERQRQFARRKEAEAAENPAVTRPRRLPNERDPKPRDEAAEAAVEERRRRLREEAERREEKERKERRELERREEERKMKLQKQQQLEQQKKKEMEQQQWHKQQQQELKRQKKQQQQQQQPGNNSKAAQKASGKDQHLGGPGKNTPAVDGQAGGKAMAKEKTQAKQGKSDKQLEQQKQKKLPQKQPEQQQQKKKEDQQKQQREPDEWEYARHEFEKPKQPEQKKKNPKKSDEGSATAPSEVKTGSAGSAVPPLELHEQQGSRGVKDLYKTEGYAKRFELAPTSVTNRSLMLQPLESYRHDWSEDADVKVRLDGDGRLVLKSNRKVPTKLPRVAADSLEPPPPATYVSSISKRERPLYDPKPKRVTGEDLGHLLPRLENLLEAPAAPKKHYSQYGVERKQPGAAPPPGYTESMKRQRERHGYSVNPEGERVLLLSSDDYNNQFYSEVRVKDAHMQPRADGQYVKRYEEQQQQFHPQPPQQARSASRESAVGEEPQADELSDRLMLQPSEQLPHYRPESEEYMSGSLADADSETQQQRRQRKFVNWKPGEVLYASGDRATGPDAPAYSERLQKQRQRQQQQQAGNGFSGLHEQRKNWFQQYNQRMLAREGNVEKVSERDLLLTTYELY